MKTHVICVIGNSYSGSTLFNMLLDTHPDVVGVGELIHVLLKTEGLACAICGESCEYFNEHNFTEIRKKNPYNTIGQIFDVNVVADTSKELVNFEKILKQQDRSAVNLIPVVLVKHPIRHIASFLLHMTHKQFRNPEYERKVLSEAKNRLHLSKVIMDQRMIPYYQALMPQIPRIFGEPRPLVIHYEDIVQDTLNTLNRIGEKAGIEFSEADLNFTEKPHHHIAGNAGAIYYLTKDKDVLNEGTGLQTKFYDSVHGLKMDDKYIELFSKAEIESIANTPSYRELCLNLGYPVMA